MGLAVMGRECELGEAENGAICLGMHFLGNEQNPYARTYIWREKIRRQHRYTLGVAVTNQGEGWKDRKRRAFLPLLFPSR